MATYNNLVIWSGDQIFVFDTVNPLPDPRGKYIHITGGSGWTPGYYAITQYFPNFDIGAPYGPVNLAGTNGPTFGTGGLTGGQGDIVDAIPGTITAAVLSAGLLYQNSIRLSWVAASGGTGALTTHLWRGENREGALLTDLGNVSGVTTFTDTSGLLGTRTYNYYLVTTDTASATATSNEILTFLGDQDPLYFGLLGDSNYASGVSGRTTNAGIQIGLFLQKALGLRSVAMNNQSVGGKGIHDFVPGSGGSLYPGLAAGWSGAGVVVGFIIEAFNDANYDLTKDQYKADMMAVINQLRIDVPTLRTIILGYCFGKGSTGSDAQNQLILLYQQGQDELVNGSTILAGIKTAFRYFGANPNLLSLDANIHLTDQGCIDQGELQANGIARALYFANTGGGGGGINGTGILGMT